MVNVREQLKNMAIATGIAPAISDMYVEIVGSYSRVSWNTNSLMALAKQEPKILACRKDTQVKPTIRIKHGERTDE
ncbi:MAG: hypothetical protein GWN94_18675 [Phycisphaerae bacterium]|nr:hypothetical protein [Phycisphaerae bacterium]